MKPEEIPGWREGLDAAKAANAASEIIKAKPPETVENPEHSKHVDGLRAALKHGYTRDKDDLS